MSYDISAKPQLTFVKLEIKNNDAKKTTVLQYPDKKERNYYRATEVFGDIATKKNNYPNQLPQISYLKAITQATKTVEDIVVKIKSNLGLADRDGQAYDIAAKAAGVGGFTDMFGKGKGTDAYKFFLEVNSDDFTIRESEYKGKKEIKEYFDSNKSDGKIKLFSSEIINGNEYLAMRDKKGVIHYFDVANGLKEDKNLMLK